MKPVNGVRTYPFLAVSIALILVVSPFLAKAQDETRIDDNLGIMGTYANEVEAVITRIEQNDNVLIRVYLDKRTFADKDSFDKSANDTYSIYGLDILGNKVYNVLLYYAKVGNKMHLAYVHSSTCKPFQDFLKGMTSGDLDQALTGQDVVNIVKTLSYRINETKARYGADCSSREGENVQEIEVESGKSAYLIDDTNWKDVLSLIPLTTRHFLPPSVEESLSPDKKIKEMKNYVIFSPTLVYHMEGEKFDLYSAINFLKDFEPNKVIIVYNDAYTEKLKEKLQLALRDYQTRFITTKDYSSIWNKRDYKSIVLSEDDYATGLVASLFASYINSPLVFSSSDLASYTKYKTVYCVGDVKYSKCTQKNTTEELQRYYQQITGTDKLILVNPNDIKDESCEQITYATELGTMKRSHWKDPILSGIIKRSHCKDSLLSPLLATMKNELIVPIESEPLENGMLKLVPPKNIRNFFVDKDENFYFETFFALEKYNFDKLERQYIYLDEKKGIKFSTMSTNGNIYLAVENGDVIEIKNDNPVKICSIAESDIADATDFGADEAGNIYFLGHACPLFASCKTYIKKFDKNGNLLYESKIAEDDKLEDYVKKLSGKDIDYNVSKVKLFVRSGGIYILFSVYLLKENGIGTNYIILYKFDEEKQDENWLDNKNTYKIYSDISKNAILYMNMDNEENIYLSRFLWPDNKNPSSELSVILNEKKKYGEINDLYQDSSDFYKILLTPNYHFVKGVFSDKEKIYIIFHIGDSSTIVVFRKDTSLHGISPGSDVIKIVNSIPDCYYYSTNDILNFEKLIFESEISERKTLIEEELKKNIQTIGGSYKYLTVIASPRAIPFSKYEFCDKDDEIRLPLDREYMDGVVSGRIYGITVSDTSSYINRVLSSSNKGETFVLSDGKMKKFGKIGMAASGFPHMQNYVSSFKETLTYNGYDVVCAVGDESISQGCDYNDKKADIEYFTGKDILVYDGHGLIDSLIYVPLTSSYASNMPEMTSTIAIVDACLTGNYYNSYVDILMPNLFASNFLRKGGLAYFGAVSVSSVSTLAQILTSEIMNGSDLGNALESTLKDPRVISSFAKKKAEPNYALFGDPTIKPALKKEVELKYVEPLKGENKDKYKCTLVDGGTKCYRKGYYQFYCNGDEITCEELKTPKPKIKGAGESAYVLFGDEMFIQGSDSIKCLDYEGNVLASTDWDDVWLGEMVCNTDEGTQGTPEGDVKISKLVGGKLVSVNP